MKIKELKELLSRFNDEAEIAIYDDDNDRELSIACIDEDDADESACPKVFIFV